MAAWKGQTRRAAICTVLQEPMSSHSAIRSKPVLVQRVFQALVQAVAENHWM